MMGVQPIPTWYAEVRFRSRLEARWARFFDHLGWPWLYEPVDYAGWIPDFVLTFRHAPLFVEVKPFDRPRQGELAHYASKIDRAGCPYEVLLVGACGPWPEGSGSDEAAVAVGWLRQRPNEGCTWRAGLLTGCRGHMHLDEPCPEPSGSIGVFRCEDGTGAYLNRRCGCRGNDHRYDRVVWREMRGRWALIGNAAQWMPTEK